MTSALVTGGSGYFGTILRDRLVAAGRTVRVFDLLDADDRPSAVGYLPGDVRDAAAVRAACDGVDVVFHCVAQVPLARDRQLFDSVNVLGTENLLRAASESGVRKTVLLSSSAVFGIPERNPVDETATPRPLEDYGRAKLAGERLARRYSEERGLDVTVIRPRTILGHGRLGIFQLLFSWIAAGKDVFVLGRGDNLYQFVHAEDLAAACLRAAERPGSMTYNIGAERFCSMRASLEGLIAHARTGSRVRSLPMAPTVLAMQALGVPRLAPFAPYHWLMYGRELYFDVSRAKQELGWSPRWGNVEMLCQSYDWYLAHQDELRDATAASAHRSPVRQGLLAVIRKVI
ncbi:MAG: NAD-dependent epimerase/dehydratase family protein [Chloroflexi bacterium]|nr:NAD-dependent epimerase/dehydratase family protein [Chloroflexota bacterium]